MAKLTDSKLFALAKKQKEAKQREAAAKADAEKASQLVIKELQDRGTKALEGGGVRVNLVAGDYTSYDLEAMQEALSPRVFAAATKTVVDEQALKALIDSGKIKPKTLAKFATQTPKKPYILVSYTAQ